ncbi:MAG: GNAT family N-acetyltransferase [Anaerolineae bacterium]|nr:GNAT family N-acetyltransferase [Anaerolineae bacterium]
MHRKSDQERIDFFLAASSWSGQVANCEPQRCDELAWFHPDALPENTIPYVRRAIENYRRGTWFDSFGWETGETNFYVRPTRQEDREWIGRFVAARWGSEKIVTRGKVYDCRDLPGFVARQGERNVGLATYRIEGESCEITSLDSTRPGIGIGTALIAAVKEAARQAGCRRLCLITANDNLEALGFYQRRGFALAAVHCNALEVSRQVKPQIPLVGAHRIPLRDEIELEMPM